MRDKFWNIGRTSPTPPTQNTAALDQQTVGMSGRSLAMGFLRAKQIDPKLMDELLGSGQRTNLARHHMVMAALNKFPKALPPGHDLADFTARDKEYSSVSAYCAALEQHHEDVHLETHVRAVDLRAESDTIADKILEAARKPGADPEVVAAAAQIERHDNELRSKVQEQQNRVDKAKKGGAKDMEEALTLLQHRDAEILELRRQLGLRLAADATLAPSPNPGGGGGRSTPR